MVAEIRLMNISGTVSGFTGSHAMNISLLCGMSGNQVIPIRVDADGTLFTSGVN